MQFNRRLSSGESSSAEDFNELRRANLESLHAEDLAKKRAVLVRDKHGDWQILPISGMKPARARQLLATVLKDGMRSEDAVMKMMRDRFDVAGIKQPAVQVRFKNLTVTATAAKEKNNNVLIGVSGVLFPGRITLLLGPPGSGKSTLLRTLAGQLKQTGANNSKNTAGLRVTADELTYNGQPLSSFYPERTAALIPQRDSHYAELTVEQTLDFAGRVQGAGFYVTLLAECEAAEAAQGIIPDPNTVALMQAMAKSQEHDVSTPIMLSVLGLEGCKDTVVGGPMLRGVSGGQRKRLTTGEMAMGPIRTAFMDEISTGLDSATTADIIRSFRNFCRLLDGTIVVALLQPPPDTFDLFDDVMLLAGGHIVYHGPREEILPFFQSLGFECPPDVAVADFLQEVVVPLDQHKYWHSKSSSSPTTNAKKPMEPAEIAAAFQNSSLGKTSLTPLSLEFRSRAGLDASALATGDAGKYGHSSFYLLRACLHRGLLLERSSLPLSIARVLQTIFTAFLTGTMFLNESKSSIIDGSLFISVAFFSVSFMSTSPLPDASALIDNLPPFYKQRNARFFPAYVYAATTIILRLPWIFIDSFLWSIMVYFMVGFSANGARFIVFWAVNAMVQLFSLTLFSAIGAICRAQTTTSAVESFMLLIFMNTAGFVIYPASIQGGWIGAYWSNPWAYWLKALSINELTSSDWSSPSNGSITATTALTATLGDTVLASRSFPTSYSWVWISLFAWGIGASILNFIIFSLALTYLGPLQGVIATATEVEITIDEKKKASSASLQTSSIESSLGDRDVETGASLAIPDDGAITTGPTLLASVPSSSVAASPSPEKETPAALKFAPLTMTFKDLKYSVPISGGSTASSSSLTKGEERQEKAAVADPHAGQLLLLKGITGSFRPCILTALMGASGAGKTTLLDVLAGRKTSGVISGEIMVNGFPKDSLTFAKVSGYCEQEDIHEGLATVHEALQFSARLRLSSKLSSSEVETFVQEVEELVELSSLRNAAVGIPGQSGLSVEQRKRLTLAVELVANPAIIFLDEPTSGLDARAAGVVMRAIRAAASTGRAVVATIHQPSATIFSAFDELLLLKRGGETIFFGPLGGTGAPLLVSYLQSLPKVPPIVPGINPANWMLDVTSPDAESQTGCNFAALYSTSDLAQRTFNQVNEVNDLSGSQNLAPLTLADLAVPSWGRQFTVLLHRDIKSYSRDLSYNVTRLVISIVIALCYATLYQGQGSAYTTTAGIFNIAGAIFASVLFLGVIDALMVQEIASRKRVIYYREHAASFYSSSAFSLSEAVVELPFLVVQAVLYSVIVYFAIDFGLDVGKFFWFLAVMIITLFTFTFFGQLLVHVTPNIQLASASFAVALSALQLFCGFLKPYGLISRGWKWAYWLNPLSYTLYALVGGQLGDIEELTTLPDGVTQMPVKVFVEETFGFKYSFVKWTIVIMIAFAFGFRIFAFMALKYLKFQSR